MKQPQQVILMLAGVALILALMLWKLHAWNECRLYGFSRSFCAGVSR